MLKRPNLVEVFFVIVGGMKPLFRKADAIVVKVQSLDEGLKFYRDALGHQLLWRNETMAAMSMGESDTELVLSIGAGPETDILVESVDDAVIRIKRAGGEVAEGPNDIPVGRVAVVKDPFGNYLTLVDLSKGRFETNKSGDVVGVKS